MERPTISRRSVLRAAAGGCSLVLAPGAASASGTATTTDDHTLLTHRAVVDAVIPETPSLGEELGPEHVPGGLEIGLDDFLIRYVDNLFAFGYPVLGALDNLPLAGPVANILDVAAADLIAAGENESEPSADRPIALLEPGDVPAYLVRFVAGPFAKLSREDRLRAIGKLDEYEIEVNPVSGVLFEIDAGMVAQLVVGFAEVIYYSEWQGYDDFDLPPSLREHPNDADAVQSWRQTGYPGVADGYAALRGYVATDGSPLGEGEEWTSIDQDVSITLESGSFRENDYDTSDYDEPYPETGGA